MEPRPIVALALEPEILAVCACGGYGTGRGDRPCAPNRRRPRIPNQHFKRSSRPVFQRLSQPAPRPKARSDSAVTTTRWHCTKHRLAWWECCQSRLGPGRWRAIPSRLGRWLRPQCRPMVRNGLAEEGISPCWFTVEQRPLPREAP